MPDRIRRQHRCRAGRSPPGESASSGPAAGFLDATAGLAIVDGTALARGRLDASRWPPRTESVDQAVTAEDVNILADTYANLNPAAIQRDIQALTAALLT